MFRDLFKLDTSFNCVPQGDERIAVRLYYKHADILLQHFDEWKDNPRFYFIPLKLNMAYFCAGGATAVALPPYYLGTILRNSLEHPELFSVPCECGHTAYAYAYNGSPLSGRFDLICACPDCGKHIKACESGWRIRSEALRATQNEDLHRGRRMALLHPGFEPATIQELLRCCGVTDEEMVLPPEEHKITRHKLGGRHVLVSDLAGGCVVFEENDISSSFPCSDI